MSERQQQLAKVILADPAVESLSSYIGVDGDNATLNSGRLLINLKPHSERDDSATEIIARLQPQLDRLVGIRLFMQPVQDLTIEDRVSRTQYQFSLSSSDAELLSLWSGRLVEALAQQAELDRCGQRPAGQGFAGLPGDRPRRSLSPGRLGVEHHRCAL